MGRAVSGFVRSSTSSQSGSSSSARRTDFASGRSIGRHSSTISFRFAAGWKTAGSIPGVTIR